MLRAGLEWGRCNQANGGWGWRIDTQDSFSTWYGHGFTFSRNYLCLFWSKFVHRFNETVGLTVGSLSD